MAQTSGPTSVTTTTTAATSNDAQALNDIAPGTTAQTPAAMAQINNTVETQIASANTPASVKGVDMGMIQDDLPNINPAALDASAAIQAREASVLQQTNFRPNLQASAKSGAIDYTAVKFGAIENLNKPKAGETVTVHADAGEQLKVNFDPNAAQLSVRNGDLTFTFNDGSRIVVDNFVMASNQMPSLLLPDGTLLAGGVVVAQLTGKNADDLFDIETAAGPGAGGAAGSGGFIYSDDLGGVIDLLDKLPPIPFTELAFPRPTEQITPFVFPLDNAPGAQPNVVNLDDESFGFNNGPLTGVITPDYGRDGAGTIGLQPGFSASGSIANDKLTSNGSPITADFNNNTVIGKDANGKVIFTIIVKPDGTYEFNLEGQLDHKDKTNPDDRIDLKFTFVVSDSDGDQATGTITIGVKDDGPVAIDDVNSVKDNNSVSANVITGVGQNGGADDRSEDNPNKISSIKFGNTTKSFDTPADVQSDAGGRFITINGQYGPLKIYENGNYTYKHNTGTGLLTEKFTYVLRDYDGDTDPATLTINIDDGVPTIPALQGNNALDETTDLGKAITGTINYTNGTSVALGTADGKAQFFADGSVAGGSLKSNGQPITVALIDGKYVGYTGTDANAAGAKVFELTTSGNNYTFKQYSNIDHADGANANDVINLKFGVTAKDGDGDTATGLLKIEVLDDAPIARPDVNHATREIREFNILGNAPDFPTLQEQLNLPKDRPDLYAQGVAKASDISIDLPTVVRIDRIEATSTIAGYKSPLFGFTQDAQGNITNVQLLFGNATSNPGNTAATSANYNMTAGGKLGFFIVGGGIDALEKIGAVDVNGNVVPGFSYKVVADGDSYKIQYTDANGTHDLVKDGKNVVPYFGGNMVGEPVYGVAGRESTDPANVLRYGFEDLPSNGNSDMDYNDVQFKITVQPIINSTTPEISGNVITGQNGGPNANDTVGQDDLTPGLTLGTKLTQVAFENGAFNPFAAAGTKSDAGGKYITLNGEYGTLKIYENGNYTYKYDKNKSDGDLKDVFKYTIIDNDGDTATTTLTITVDSNYSPTVTVGGSILDEGNLLVPGVDSVTKDISITSPDGVESVRFTTNGLPALNALGQPVVYTVSADGKTLTGTAGGQTVFTVVMTPTTAQGGTFKASYTFTLLKPLDNPGTGENVTNIPVQIVVKDGNGDTAPATIPLQVIDDLPVAHDDSKGMGTTSIATGNIITNDNFGADGAAANAPKVTSISYGNDTKTFANADSSVSFTTPKGILVIKADGSYTFTRNAGLGQLNETFNYSIKDADGDVSTAKLVITGNDNPVVIVTPDPQHPYANGNGAVLDEDDLTVPGVDSVTKTISFTAPDGVQSIKLTTDGLPSLTANDKPVTYGLSADGKTLTGTAGGLTIFTVVLGAPVKQADGSYKANYTFTLQQPLDNPGPSENTTDIPVKFIATDTDGDKAIGTLPLQVIDDVPVALSESKAMGTTLVVTGNVTANDDFGADGVATNGTKLVEVNHNGETKYFNGPDSTLTFTTSSGTLVIKVDGSYTFTRNASLGELNELFRYEIKDADGDKSMATLTITGTDNPVVIVTPNPQDPYAGGNGAVLDEDDLPVPGVDSVTKTVSFTAPDGVQSVKLTSDGLPSLTANDKPVTYAVSADGKTLTGSAGGQTIFTVVLGVPVKQADGSFKANYTFTLQQPLDNPGTGENVTNIPVKFTATDTDGDKATGTLPLQVIDDVPHAADDSKAMGTASVATGNIITNDNFGADGVGTGVSSVNSITYGGVTKTFDTPTSIVSFTTPSGTLSIKGDGSYTFTRNSSLGNLNETFNYSIKDADGDISNAKLNLTGNDNPVVIVTPNPQDPYANGNGAVLDEDDLPVPGVDSVTKSVTFTAPDGAQSIKLTTDGLPSLNANGQPVTYSLSADGKTLTGTAAGQTIFTVVLGNPVQQPDKSYKADYTFTLQQALDNPGAGENITNIPVKFTATDTDGDKATGTLPLQVIDDIPHAMDDAKAMGTTSVATGNILTNDGFGADSFGGVVPLVNSITYGGVTKTFDTMTSSVAFATPGGILEIKANGSYTFTRNGDLGNVNETFTYTIKDADNDVSSAKLVITGNDNPVVIVTPNPQNPYANGNPAVLDEDDLPVPGIDSVTKTVTFTAPDGVASVKLTTDGLPSLTANSQPVTYTVSPDGKTLTGSAGGQTIFTVVLNNPAQQPDKSYKADYTFTLLKPLDTVGAGENITNIPVKFVATDTDGDNAVGTLPLQVIDDVPVARDDQNSVADHGSVRGNVVTGAGQQGGADTLSADSPNKIIGIETAGGTRSFSAPDGTEGGVKFLNVNGQYGVLKIFENGQYTYTHTKGSGTLFEKFTYVLMDKDGDADPADLLINIQNGVPSIPDLQGDKVIDETTDINKDIGGTIAYTNGTSVALGTASGASAFEASGSLTGGKLTSNGQDVHVSLIGGKYVGYTGNDANAAGAKVFELTLNGNQYNFKQLNNIDHANKSDPNDVISLKFAVTAKDADGDTDTGLLKIDIRDDAPVANADTNTAKSTIREYNVIGGAPDFPTLQEQKNLPKDRPDLYKMGVDKASNVFIDQATTIQIERFKSPTEVSVVSSPLFAFTQDANGKFTNIKLIYGIASANPDDNGPMTATYEMQGAGKLGFFIAGGGTEALKSIGAIDANGISQPGFSFGLKDNGNGKFDIQYTHNGETKTLMYDASSPLVARFAGDFMGQDIQGVAGRQDGDANNTLRYGFEDLPKATSDEDYNDVQIKVTVNPIITEVTDPIHGNVLQNDIAGQDNLAGWQYGTKVTQVAVGANSFITFAGTNSSDGEGKFISVKGEYGTLKIYEDGHYTYVYAGTKKDGDLVDDFRYTITDYDGDTSSSTLKVTINPATSMTAVAMLSASAEVAHAVDAPATMALVAHENDGMLSASKHVAESHDGPQPLSSAHHESVVSYDEPVRADAHDVDGQLLNGNAASYSLGHQGSETALHADLTSHGEVVKTIVVDDVVHGFTGADYDARSADVFSLSLDPNGHYAFDLQGKIDQADAGTLLSFDYTAKDTDGSAIEGQVIIGVQGEHAAAVTPAPASSLALHDLLDSPAAAPHTDVAVNTLSNADIINSILDDDHPANGYAGS